MKIIYNNEIQTISASSSQNTYPVANAIDDNIGKVWKSVQATGGPSPVTMSFDVPVVAGSTIVLAMLGIKNAPTVSISAHYSIVTGYGTNPPSYADKTFVLSGIDANGVQTKIYDRLWAEYAAPSSGTLSFLVTLSGLSLYEIAEIVSGRAISLPDPQYGASQTREDNSIKQKLAGGGYHVHDASKPRKFNLSWIMERQAQFDDLDALYNERGSRPLAMLISENMPDTVQWCGYFHMIDPPTATHDLPYHSTVNLSLLEAI